MARLDGICLEKSRMCYSLARSLLLGVVYTFSRSLFICAPGWPGNFISREFALSFAVEFASFSSALLFSATLSIEFYYLLEIRESSVHNIGL